MNYERNVLVVKTTKPPSYIKTLTGNDDEIILVHSKVRNTNNIDESFIPEGLKDELSLEGSLLDITGSPMKYSFDNSAIMCMSILDQCQNHWSKEEETHYPLTVTRARTFIQDYFSKNTTSKVLWCVCDGLDTEKTLLMSYQKQPNFISRSIVTTHGYLPEKMKERTLDNLFSKHIEISNELQERKKESFSFYELYGTPIHELSKNIKTQTKGYVTLEVIEGSNNKLTLDIQALIGHPDASSYQLWQDLLLLELYINTLSQYKDNEQMGNGFWLPTAANVTGEDDLIQMAASIVHDLDMRVPHDKERNTELLSIINDVKHRQSLDITDRLWFVLVRCSAYGTLVDCLNAFMAEVAYNRGKIYISNNNISWLAELLRGVIAGQLAVPTFTGTQPIQLLILLGIEKLRKDYAHILSQSNIIDEQQINSYLKYGDCNENLRVRKGVVLRDTQLVQLDRVVHEMGVLGRLETLCELLSLVPNDWLHYVSESAVKLLLGINSPVKSFTALAGGSVHGLRVELPACAIQQSVGLCMPVKIGHIVDSQTKYMRLVSTLHLALRPTFPPCLCFVLPPENTTDIKNVCYHYTTMLQITNYFNKQS